MVINPLFAGELVEQNYHRPIQSLALDPDFHRKKTRSVRRLVLFAFLGRLAGSLRPLLQFAAGLNNGQLMLNEKGACASSSLLPAPFSLPMSRRLPVRPEGHRAAQQRGPARVHPGNFLRPLVALLLALLLALPL